jgi:hypothetical protein
MGVMFSVGKASGPTKGRCALAVLVAVLFVPLAGLAAANPQKAPFPIPSTITPKAQALITLTTQALGGQAFLKWKTLTTKGRAFAIQEGQTAGFEPFRSTVEPPDKRRLSYGSGHPVTLINNGDEGWQVDQYGMIHQKSSDIEEWKTANRYSLDNILRYVIHEKGILAEDDGTDFIENRPARVLEISDARQTQIKLYIEQGTGLPLQVTYQMLDPNTQEQREYTDVYSDYLPVQGIQTPMHVTRYEDGDRVAEIFRTSARYDDPVPPNFFELPQ